ncbi:MAG: hypothetical protein ACOC15_01980 [Desulfovibrionales bacterium]
MATDRFNGGDQTPEHIPGVYNYCDRWCERCTMTSRCLVFARSGGGAVTEHGAGAANQAFWDRLREMFRISLELIEELAQDMDIDLDSLTTAHDEAGEEVLDRAVDQHVLVLQAGRYMDMVEEWFKGERASQGSPDIRELEEVILYYSPFVLVKLKRAVRALLEAGDGEELSLMDASGSAKAALVAVERSTAAWWGLRGHFQPHSRPFVTFWSALNPYGGPLSASSLPPGPSCVPVWTSKDIFPGQSAPL